MTIAMIPGDGVGPELMQGVKKVFNSASKNFCKFYYAYIINIFNTWFPREPIISNPITSKFYFSNFNSC